MGNYLSRDDILKAGLRTVDVPFRDGELKVQELPGAEVQRFFDEGIISFEGEGENMNVVMDGTKLNFMKIAASAIIDPETNEPMFSVEELRKLPFGLSERAATAAMDVTDWGEEVEEEEKKD